MMSPSRMPNVRCHCCLFKLDGLPFTIGIKGLPLGLFSLNQELWSNVLDAEAGGQFGEEQVRPSQAHESAYMLTQAHLV